VFPLISPANRSIERSLDLFDTFICSSAESPVRRESPAHLDTIVCRL
jgi:hypothetical protein